MPPKLGTQYRDTATGFIGTCTGILHYLGRTEPDVQLENLEHDGKKVTSIWVPAGRLTEDLAVG